MLLQKRKHAIGDSDIIYQFEANKKHSMSGVIPSLMKLKDPQVEGGININSSQGKYVLTTQSGYFFAIENKGKEDKKVKACQTNLQERRRKRRASVAKKSNNLLERY